MKISDQVRALRKLCVHSEFLCLVTPHVNGGIDDESDFTVELIRSILDRPEGYRQAEIEVHSEAPDKPDCSDYAAYLLWPASPATSPRPFGRPYPTASRFDLCFGPDCLTGTSSLASTPS